MLSRLFSVGEGRQGYPTLAGIKSRTRDFCRTHLRKPLTMFHPVTKDVRLLVARSGNEESKKERRGAGRSKIYIVGWVKWVN